MAIEIVPYEAKYFEDVREVCFGTTTEYFKDKRPLLNLLYCDYYILKQPQHTLVAVSGGNAIGYIMCAEAKQYAKEFRAEYLPKIKRLSFANYLSFKYVVKDALKKSKVYDMHLHIDILPQFQRQGIGHMLVDSLLQHLRNIGAKGVYLSVGANNKMGINFYKKYGFEMICDKRMGKVFGIKISD